MDFTAGVSAPPLQLGSAVMKPPLPGANHGFLGGAPLLGWFDPGAAAGEVAEGGFIGRIFRLGTRFCTIASGDRTCGGGAVCAGAGGFKSRSFACASPEKRCS